MTPATFRAAVNRFLVTHRLAESGQPILVACSGGPDSVALLHVLLCLGHPVAVAHVNYGLRGHESDTDEAFVRELATNLQVPVFVCRASPRDIAASEKISIQVAARRIRYRFFSAQLKQLGWDRVATGHHRGDQVETIVLNLLRGHSSELLKGIPKRRGPIIRPLLFASKSQLIDYLKSEGLTWREDRSNTDLNYLRNRIRHAVLPALATINPRIEEQLIARAELYTRQFEALTAGRRPAQPIKHILTRQAPDFIGINFERLAAEQDSISNDLFNVLFSIYLEQEYRIRPTDARRMVQLLDAQPGAWVATRAGQWWRTSEGLQLAAPTAASPVPIRLVSESGASVLPEPLQLPLARGTLRLDMVSSDEVSLPPPVQVYYLDLDRVVGQLVLRPWQAGERFQPFKFSGTRLVSDELTDAKFPAHLKKLARVLADEQGPIWVETGRLAQRVALSESTKRVLRLCKQEPKE